MDIIDKKNVYVPRGLEDAGQELEPHSSIKSQAFDGCCQKSSPMFIKT